MSRRRRNKTRAARTPTAGVRLAVEPADHHARVLVDEETWEAFKAAVPAGGSVSRVLGDLVARHVHTVQARQAKDGELDDGQLLDALQRAEELQNDLSYLLDGIHRRLNPPRQAPASPSSGPYRQLPFTER